MKWTESIRQTVKHWVRRMPALWRVWLDFRHALRLFELALLAKRTYFNRAHRGHLWDYAAKPHQERNDRVLQALDARKVGADSTILEIGCSEGVFTSELAKRFARVIAIDVSDVACVQARNRCAKYGNVTVRTRDICREPLKSDERYDVVVAMDVWDYLCRSRTRLRAFTEHLSRSLRVNGLLIMTDCRIVEQQRKAWWQRWFPFGADAHFEHIQADPSFSLVWRDVHEGLEDYPSHLLAIWRKTPLNCVPDTLDIPETRSRT